MTDALDAFENIVRMAVALGNTPEGMGNPTHPFDERNIHAKISSVSIELFDDGHYSQATFEAFKYIDLVVRRVAKVKGSGYTLMMTAFAEQNPKIKLTALTSQSEIDEQIGYKFIFAGAMSAIRNPRGHGINVDPISRCLDHLSLASVLLRRLEDAVP